MCFDRLCIQGVNEQSYDNERHDMHINAIFLVPVKSQEA